MSPSRPDPVAALRRDLIEELRRSTVGEFEIFRQLGKGGMATVFLAHDIALDRSVAIKVMSPALMLEEGMAERFRREARTAANLNHPHIIPVYSVRQTETLLFFVMKYIEGRPLDQVIREFAPLPLETTQRILAQVSSALAYAHRRGVVHRDIKPANIMLDTDGWAIVTDFGIARVGGTPGLTSSGVAVGTPAYMSPEQYTSLEISGQSDQYSLGVVAYEMLTGRLPFGAETTAEVIKGHLLDTPRPITEVRPDCPPVLTRVVMRMLEKESQNRWPSIDEAIRELHLPPVPEDDEIRTGIINLAKSGPKRMAIPIPPASPIPDSRRRLGLGMVGYTESGASSGWLTRGLRARLVSLSLIALVGIAGAAYLVSRLVSRPPPSSTRPAAPAQESTPRAAVAPPPPPALGQPVRRDSAKPTPPKPTSKPGSSGSSIPAPVNPHDGKPAVAIGLEKSESPADSVPSAAPPPNPVPPPAAGPQWSWIKIGTKDQKAFLYINGQPMLPQAPSLRWWRVRAGIVSLSIQAEGCSPWEETRTLGPGDSVSVGYRYPSCPP